MVLHNMRFLLNWYDLLEAGAESKAFPMRSCLGMTLS